MKGKFFYKIDYNTDNGKKQHRNSKVGKKLPQFGKQWSESRKKHCIFGLAFPTLEQIPWKNRFWMHNLRGKSDTKGCRRTKKHSGGNKIMTRNSKNEYSKNEYSKNGYEKSEYSKNQKNSRDCNHVKDREMSSYGQQNREQDEKDEYEKY